MGKSWITEMTSLHNVVGSLVESKKQESAQNDSATRTMDVFMQI